jgi:hypothetical protein
MASQQHRELAQSAELRCLGLGRVKSGYREIQQSWVSGLQMPSFFIKTVQSGQMFDIKPDNGDLWLLGRHYCPAPS